MIFELKFVDADGRCFYELTDFRGLVFESGIMTLES